MVPGSRNHFRRLGTVSVIADHGVFPVTDGLGGTFVTREPVAKHFAHILRHTANKDGRGLRPKRVVMDADRFACDQGAVLATAPTAVHIKAVSQRGAQLDVVSGNVTAVSVARAGYRMSVGVEQIALDN